jgi:hypothetical protein
LIAISLLLGCLIPAFYDWTGSDQSRPSPLIWQTALGLTVSAAVVCFALPWLPIRDEAEHRAAPVRFQFKLRTLLAMTAGVAAIIAALAEFPMLVSSILCAISFGCVVRYWVLYRCHRWATAALTACMYLPFFWIFMDGEPKHLFPEILWMASGLPSLFPALLIGGLLGQNQHDTMWLPVLLTGVVLAAGILSIRMGPRRTLACLLIVLLMSTFGSFVLNALARA